MKRPVRWKLVWMPVISFCVASAFFVASWRLAGYHEERSDRTRTALVVEQAAVRLEEYIRVRLDIAAHMAHLWDRGFLETPEQFRAHAQDVHDRFGGFIAINRVDAEGIIRQVVPEERNLPALGKDLKQHPEAAATFVASMKTGTPHVTPPLNLLQGGRGFAAYFPVKTGGEARGFVNAVFAVAPILEQAVTAEVIGKFHVTVSDGDTEIVASGRPSTERDRKKGADTRPVRVGGRVWNLTITPSPTLGFHLASHLSGTVLLAGILLSAGLALILRRVYLREAALAESEERYRTIFESAQVGLIRIRLGDGKVLEANEAAAAICGYDTREEFLREYYTVPNWFDPADRDRMYEEFAAGGGALRGFETRFKRKDGSPVWVRVSARMFPEKGYIQGVLVGIDDEKNATQALQASERKFRTLADSTSAAILIIRGERIIYANPAALRQLGYDAGRIREIHPNSLLTPESAERLQKYGADFMEGKEVPPALELEALTAGGQRRWIEMTVGPLEMDGDLAIVSTSFDIHDRKTAEEARLRAEQMMFRAEKMAALGQVIAGVAHEINNPNNFIYFNLPILRRYIDAVKPRLDECMASRPGEPILGMSYEAFVADMYKLLENMQHGSTRITEIVSELKNYIRSHETDEKKPESIRTVIDRVMTLVGKQVRKTVKTFEVDVPDTLPPVLVNAGKVEQVLINIIVNAGQAADKDDSRVTVTAAKSRFHPARVEVAIGDNGCGIATEHMDRIFDPFFTTKGREAGTGLGLAISHRIVEEHGGAIHVESEPGRGTRFIVELPIAPEAA